MRDQSLVYTVNSGVGFCFFCFLVFVFLWGFFDRPCLRFICTNATGGPQPRGTPVLLSSHRQTEASTVEPSQGPGHLWEPETEPEPELELELQLNLQPGAWFGSWPWPLAGRAGDPW